MSISTLRGQRIKEIKLIVSVRLIIINVIVIIIIIIPVFDKN